MTEFISSYSEIERILKKNSSKKPMLVCGKSFQQSYIFKYLKQFNIFVYDNIRPNPRFDDMITAAKLFNEQDCDFIIAAGGGSHMDSAKMIRLMATNDVSKALSEPMENNDIPSLFIPTTAGSGSEATKTSVFYINDNKKFSIHNLDFIPNYVLFDEKLLKTVPPYQRRSTCLDALCHSIESYWSTKANDESKGYAEKGITLFFENLDDYLKNTDKGNKEMLAASYYGGRAINITGTTAGHAMCYNLTMNCGTAHGHSVAEILVNQWEYMIKNNSSVNDERGRRYVLDTFDRLGKIMGGKNADDGLSIFKSLLKKLEMKSISFDEKRLDEFVEEINPQKLLTNPTVLEKSDVYEIYKMVLNYGI